MPKNEALIVLKDDFRGLFSKAFPMMKNGRIYTKVTLGSLITKLSNNKAKYIQLCSQIINVGLLVVVRLPRCSVLLAKRWTWNLLISALRIVLKRHGLFTNWCIFPDSKFRRKEMRGSNGQDLWGLVLYQKEDKFLNIFLNPITSILLCLKSSNNLNGKNRMRLKARKISRKWDKLLLLLEKLWILDMQLLKLELPLTILMKLFTILSLRMMLTLHLLTTINFQSHFVHQSMKLSVMVFQIVDLFKREISWT